MFISMHVYIIHKHAKIGMPAISHCLAFHFDSETDIRTVDAEARERESGRGRVGERASEREKERESERASGRKRKKENQEEREKERDRENLHPLCA